MAGLAHILIDLGVEVSGSDATDSEMLQRLAVRGANVSVGHDGALVEGADILVYSSAIHDDNPELAAAHEQGIPTCRRGEFLAELAKQFPVVVSVAGSHGKTTTTSMLVHILRHAGLNPGWMVGGFPKNLSRNAGAGGGQILVTEVDESDGTQALMKSTFAIVVNVDDDHAWSLGGIEALEDCFRLLAVRADKLVSWSTDITRRVFAGHGDAEFVTSEMIPEELVLNVPGDFYRINATLAAAVAQHLGVPLQTSIEALGSYEGVARRMSIRYRTPDRLTLVIEDYAHHPAELRSTLEGIRQAWPEYRIIAMFQPHRFERIRMYAAEFSHELSKCSAAIVVSPFAAWTDDSDIADPTVIYEALTTVRGYYTDDITGLGNYLVECGAVDTSIPTVYVVIGAGDVNKSIPGICNTVKWAYMNSRVPKLAEPLLSSRIEHTLAWSDLTTLGVGNGIPWIASIDNTDDLEILCNEANRLGVPLLPIGNGSNMVGTDEEIDKLVVRFTGPNFEKLIFSHHDIIAGAAVPLRKLIQEMVRHDCCPPELAPLSWIPGLLAGAVRVNACTGEGSVSSLVEQICGYLPDGTLWAQDGSSITWERNRVTGIPEGMLISSLVLRRGLPGKSAEAMTAMNESRQQRAAAQPPGRSAGCIFRNPANGGSAGKLIDQCGLKGANLNGCYVSQVHANYLMAEPGSRSRDFIDLVLYVQLAVFRATGTVLDCGVQFVSPNDSERIVRQTAWLKEEAASRGELTAKQVPPPADA